MVTVSAVCPAYAVGSFSSLVPSLGSRGCKDAAWDRGEHRDRPGERRGRCVMRLDIVCRIADRAAAEVVRGENDAL